METKLMKKHSKPKKNKKTQLFTTIAMLCWGCGRFAIFVKNFVFFVVVFVFVFECFFIICCFHPFSFFVFFCFSIVFPNVQGTTLCWHTLVSEWGVGERDLTVQSKNWFPDGPEYSNFEFGHEIWNSAPSHQIHLVATVWKSTMRSISTDIFGLDQLVLLPPGG